MAAALVVVASTAGAATVLASPLRYLSGTVVIGVNGTLPSWSLPNSENNLDGFDVALAHFLRDKYKFRLELVTLSPDKRETALRDGDVDLVIANFSMSGDSAVEPSKQRSEYIDFAGPYFRDRSAVIYDEAKRARATRGESGIPAKNVCMGAGTTAEKNSKRLGMVKPQTECFAGFADASSPIVGVMTDQSILAAYSAANAKGEVVPAVWKNDPDYPINENEFYGIGLPDNSPDLCRELDSAVNEFIKNRWTAAFNTYLPTIGELDFHKPSPTDSSHCAASPG